MGTQAVTHTHNMRQKSPGKSNGKSNGKNVQLELGGLSAPTPARSKPVPSSKANAELFDGDIVVAEQEAEATPAKTRGKREKVKTKVDAQSMASKQRDISISEFFTKNRHLLGFDNPQKSLLTTVREAVDNALDACEEASILPRIDVGITEVAEDRYVVFVEDNGPGIVRAQLPKIFGKLLYGSKFHRLKQSRGQQGIGISAASMYGQLTTGKPVVTTSKTGRNRDVNRISLQIDTAKNQPVVVSEENVVGDEHWDSKESGTLVEIELLGAYKGGQHSVESYLRQTALANPHAELYYTPPKGSTQRFARVVHELPPEPKEIQPHPHGIELGILMRMLKEARGKTINQFLTENFSRVSSKVAQEILDTAHIKARATTAEVHRQDVENLYNAIQVTKVMAPPTDCLSPIGVEAIQRGLLALLYAREQLGDGVDGEIVDQIMAQAAAEPETGIETDGMFVTAVTRPPAVYRGNPFQVEVGLAYGKGLPADQLAKVFRFANRVPLLYQQSACAMSRSVMQTAWRNYDIQQARGALPTAPMAIMVHLASVWVPYTSESKEAIAHYPEILKELKLALQEVGRKLAIHVRRQRREADEDKKQRYIQKYIDPIGEALKEILGLKDADVQNACDTLRDTLERSKKM